MSCNDFCLNDACLLVGMLLFGGGTINCSHPISLHDCHLAQNWFRTGQTTDAMNESSFTSIQRKRIEIPHKLIGELQMHLHSIPPSSIRHPRRPQNKKHTYIRTLFCKLQQEQTHQISLPSAETAQGSTSGRVANFGWVWTQTLERADLEIWTTCWPISGIWCPIVAVLHALIVAASELADLQYDGQTLVELLYKALIEISKSFCRLAV